MAKSPLRGRTSFNVRAHVLLPGAKYFYQHFFYELREAALAGCSRAQRLSKASRTLVILVVPQVPHCAAQQPHVETHPVSR